MGVIAGLVARAGIGVVSVGDHFLATYAEGQLHTVIQRRQGVGDAIAFQVVFRVGNQWPGL
ncbi:hypothetical protein D3C79_892610 [compost metagenome]